MTLIPRERPLIFDPNSGQAIDLTPASAPAAPALPDLVGAAFRQENVVGSLLARQWESNEPVDGYNAWDEIKGTEYEPHWDKFVESRNPGYTAALKRQIDMETEDRNTIAAGGGWGVLASIGAGVFSPENLVPGGTIYRGVKGGVTIAKSALSTATAAALSTTAAEAMLLGSQELRTPAESAINVGSAAVLGGALGAGISAVFSKSDFARLAKGIDKDSAVLFDPDAAELARPVADEMTKRLVAAGRSGADAKAEASLYASFYGTMSKRTGKSVDELLSASPLPEVRLGGAPDPDGLTYNQAGLLATDTPEFNRWFGESKVVDAEGKPLVVYHGSPNPAVGTPGFAFRVGAAEGRRTDFGNFGDGVYATPQKFIADIYARGNQGRGPAGATLPLYVSIQNPLRITVAGGEYTEEVTRIGEKLGVTATPEWRGSGQHNPEWSRQFRAKAMAAGYDGVITQNLDGSMGSEVVAFTPTQIKSAENNRGTFDPNDPRILYQPAYHGSPHIFDRFRWDDTTRGKGEGAQAFGDGLYFAGNKEVARYYREALTGDGLQFPDGTIQRLATRGDVDAMADKVVALLRERGVAVSGADEAGIWDAFDNADTTAGNAIDAAIKWSREQDGDARAARVAELLGPLADVLTPARGRLYKVDIPDDTEMLDWDRPIREMSAEVRAKLEPLGLSDFMRSAEDAVGGPENAAALDVSTRGHYFYEWLAKKLGGGPEASAALREAGIPGHRFLDQGSRVPVALVNDIRRKLARAEDAAAAAPDNARLQNEVEELRADLALAEKKISYNYVIYDDSRVAIQEFEQANRGSIEFGNPQAIIRLFETADRSTFLHETGHFFLQNFQSLSRSAPELSGDWDELSKYLGIGEDGRISVEAHEKFARSFEAYLLEGKAPSTGLKAAFDQFREWLLAVYRQIASMNAPINDDVRGILDRMLATDAEIARARDPQLANEDAILRSLRAGDAGAAAREVATLNENTIAGRGAQVAGGAVKFLNPVLRVLHSASPVVRDVGTRLFENPVYLKKNFAGVASDPAVETLVKEFTQGAMARAVDEANTIYSDFRKAGGQLDRERFSEAVGKAMRRGDEDADPAVARAAKVWRANVFDPLKEKAIEAGLLPRDVSVSEALSYFTRVYNRPLIEAREAEFKGIVRRYIDKSIRDLEFKSDEIKIGNKIVEADKASDRWRAAFDRLSSIEDRLAGRAAVRRRKMEELGRLQQLRFDAAKDRPPAELWKRLRNADENKSMLDVLKELRTAERASGKQKYADKYPVLSILKRRGGVKVGSFLDHELRNMGVTPKTHPGLFKSDGGLGAIDNWPWDEEELFQVHFGRMPDGYVDQNELLDAIRKEVGGDPLQTPDQIVEAQNLDALDSWASQWLDSVGLPQSTSVGDARAFIKRIVGAEKQYDELGQRINRLERELDEFDQSTEGVANERLVSEAETANLAKELAMLEEEILAVQDIARSSPRVGIIVDYAKVRRDLFRKRLDEQRLRRRVESLKTLRDEGRANDELLAELGAKSTDLTRVLDAIDKLKAKADKLEPMVPKIRQELPEFLNEADRASYVNEVVDNIFNTITGRNVDGDMPRDIVAATRGPLKERTFHIPDTEIEQFLESNVEAVARRYARTMAADIELTNAFGKADLKEQINQVKRNYQELREAAEQGVDPQTGQPLEKPLTGRDKEKRLAELAKAEKNDIRDLQALRDMVRGAYLARENASNFARTARVAGTVNYLRTMGGVTLSSLADVARHVMVHGLTGVMRDGLVPLMSNLKGFKMSVEEAKLAGAVTERLLNTRMATWADITDPYSVSSPFERFMENTANGFSRLNGLVYWNDFQKSFASVITQNRVLRGSADYGRLDKREKAYLAYLGIDGSMAERIAKQFDTHGTVEDGGVRVAHTDDWDDEWAKRTYRAAINKDVDSTIITKGVGDVPLFMNTPAGRLLMQFKGFAIASHQRALMRGLQERPMGFVAGTMLATTVGMMIYYLKAVESNRVDQVMENPNPGRWIAEGLDRSGIFSIAFEANNTIEKSFNIGAYAALSAAFPGANQEGKASKYASRSVAASLLGPTGDFIDTAIRAANAIKGAGDGMTEGDIGAIKRMLPGATLPGIRSLVEYLGVPAVRGGLAID